MVNLDRIFKAYDIRGIVPDELDPDLVRDVGAAMVEALGIADAPDKKPAVVIGYDMRPSSPKLAAAFAEGVTSQGGDVIDIGLASTDELYFASGYLDLPGAMFTASHNPAQYNGIKLCRPGAAPIGSETGLNQIRELVAKGPLRTASTHGTVEKRDLLSEYAGHLKTLVDLSRSRQLTVVIDAGNGMAGYTVPAVFQGLPYTVIPMYFELDGTFPNHEANPIEPENLKDLQAEVRKTGADIGLAFDGDADRCFVVDERGELVSPSTITALIASRELRKHPGATIIHNLITSRVVPEIIVECGGKPVRTRVGHSYIKARMAETGAVFGGEHSGHFYFRDFWRADSGMLAALHTLAALGETPPGTTLSQLLANYSRYVASGEINRRVADQAARTAAIRTAFAGRDVEMDDVDGLTVSHADWWFNVRPSNTEPLLRLNVEATDRATMERIRDEVLALMEE